MKKQFFLVLLLTVFSLILVENIKAQEGISTYSTVNYDAANNTVSGYSYTYATYANSGYYDPQVTSYIADSDDNVLDSQTVLGRSNASALLFANGTGCGEYRIVSSHSAVVQYYATAYFYNNDYRDGYYDLFDYSQFSEQGQSYPLSYSFFAPAVSTVSFLDYSEIILGSTENTDFTSCFAPAVTGVTAQVATEVTAKLGNTDIIHFVTPKGSTNDLVTLTATISPDNQANRNKINWDGATESANNPLVATVSKSSAAKNVVKIKYSGNTIKELRVWVVWATITSSLDFPITPISGTSGNPAGPANGIEGGYNFTHTIQPSTIITDSNRPDFCGNPNPLTCVTNMTAPTGTNHPIQGTSLSGGANKKWDASRQIRFKILNPNNISYNDTSFSTFGGMPSDLLSYPSDNAEGNDDANQGDEIIELYTQAKSGIILSQDTPPTAINARAGIDGNTFESRLQFREFTRLEIQGVWHRISDFYEWKFHRKLKKDNGKWVNDNSILALGNSGF
jgi:hypothetical protein